MKAMVWSRVLVLGCVFAFGFVSVGCSGDDGEEVSAASDPSEASDSSDATDSADASDPSSDGCGGFAWSQINPE